jgi:predicted secreted hydrolase
MEARSEGVGFTVRLEALDGEFGIDLELTTEEAPVAHGERGLDRKGPEPGNASYYYSVPRLAANGRVTLEGKTLPVVGSAWMDREWGTSALRDGVVGWDWFALQLSNGGSLMFYRLRQEDGEASPFSAGTLLGSDGTVRALGARDVELRATENWVSRATGAVYPVGWSLAVPSLELSLVIEPLLANQELDLSVRYWEGAVEAAGSWEGAPVQAVGYVELTGY